MLIELLLSLFYNIFDKLTTFINIPSLPSGVDDFLSDALGYIDTGIRILANFMPMQYFAILFSIIIVIEVGLGIYHLVMWVLKKIPMASIS